MNKIDRFYILVGCFGTSYCLTSAIWYININPLLVAWNLLILLGTLPAVALGIRTVLDERTT